MTEVTSEETLGTSFYQPGDPVKQTLLFGTGCSQRVGEFAKTLGSHALVVTDPGIMTAGHPQNCLLYTSPSPRDAHESRMPSSA